MKVGTDSAAGVSSALRPASTQLQTELPEVATPLILPKRWTRLTTMTVAFGHGIAVTPLQAAVADAALVNGGISSRRPSSREPQAEAARSASGWSSARDQRTRCASCSASTSRRAPATADVPGYLVGGKTGTAEKVDNGRYSAQQAISTPSSPRSRSTIRSTSCWSCSTIRTRPRAGGWRHRRPGTPRPTVGGDHPPLGGAPRRRAAHGRRERLPCSCPIEGARCVAMMRRTEAATGRR